MSSILAATDLVVRYNERVILDGATLGVEEGDRIGLVGRNGCGKTTFLRILAGLQTADSGEVTARRELVVSYLSQDFTLEGAVDVRGNVRRGAWRTLDLIAEFESLPAESRRHEELERRIEALDGWTLEQRVESAMSHLDCPPGDRRVDSLSGRRAKAGRVGAGDSVAAGAADFGRADEPSRPGVDRMGGGISGELPGGVFSGDA